MKLIDLPVCLLGLALVPAVWGAKPEPVVEARPPAATPASSAASATVKSKPAPVDINTNTDPAKLRALDIELTAARAQAIIDGRPYGNIDELVGQRVLPQKLFDRIKGHLTASKSAKP